MLFTALLVVSLLLLSPTVWSRSSNPLDNYDPNTSLRPYLGALSPSVIPTTEGWEYFSPNGQLMEYRQWEVQRPSSMAELVERSFEARLGTTKPNQALSLLFVGSSLTVQAILNPSDDGFSLSYTGDWALFVDGVMLPSREYGDIVSKSVMTFDVPLKTDSYHNVTFRTGPIFKGNFTFYHAFFNTSVTAERYVKIYNTP